MDTAPPPPLPHRPGTSPEGIARNRRINLILFIVLPFVFALGTLAVFGGFSYRGGDAGDKSIVSLCLFCPALIGYAISLKWRGTQPWKFFLIGAGMTCAVYLALLAIFFAGCLMMVGTNL
ncbi:MAG: hypothetical protein H7A52_14300 [Akkermansiaceae bacterium]|nr:hypothetical protein [Akkermansiaceae bacterium]